MSERPSYLADEELLRHAAPKRSWAGYEPVARRVVLGAARRGVGGRIDVTESTGTTSLGSGEPVAKVRVWDRRTYGALLRSGSVGLGASYIAGWWDAEDLTALVRVLFRRTVPMRRRLDALGRSGGFLLDLPSRIAAPGRGEDRSNIQAHYDISNDFFAVMLDETMTYSCAIFEDPEMSLRDAQMVKIDRICRKLDLQPEDTVVEIGSGWGSFAIHAAGRYGSRVTTTTISDAQRVYVEKRVAAAGLADRITVLDSDWRDMHGKFDKLVSVEMVEAVDWRHHDEFLRACSALLTDDGLAALQAIVIDDRSFERAKRHRDFIKEMVFPGGCIPSVTSIADSLVRATDLRIVDLEDIGRHYAETLRRWSLNLKAHSQEVDQLGAGVEFRRLWDLYLAYCEASFLERHVSDVQIVIAKPAWRGDLRVRAD
jgi:cyclopropane-fatty-acyl-phospholipid synthase